MGRIKHLVKKQEFTIFIILIALCLVATCFNTNFMSAANITDLIKSIAFSIIASGAMAFMIISGNLDLSCGAMITLGGMAAGGCMVSGIPWPLAIVFSLGLCAAFGLASGLLVVKVGINSVIATLGMQYVIKGCVYVTTKGNPFYPLDENFCQIGQGTAAGIPIVILIAAAVCVCFHIILSNTIYGRSIMALGGNDEAADWQVLRQVPNESASMYYWQYSADFPEFCRLPA